MDIARSARGLQGNPSMGSYAKDVASTFHRLCEEITRAVRHCKRCFRALSSTRDIPRLRALPLYQLEAALDRCCHALSTLDLRAPLQDCRRTTTSTSSRHRRAVTARIPSMISNIVTVRSHDLQTVFDLTTSSFPALQGRTSSLHYCHPLIQYRSTSTGETVLTRLDSSECSMSSSCRLSRSSHSGTSLQ